MVNAAAAFLAVTGAVTVAGVSAFVPSSRTASVSTVPLSLDLHLHERTRVTNNRSSSSSFCLYSSSVDTNDASSATETQDDLTVPGSEVENNHQQLSNLQSTVVEVIDDDEEENWELDANLVELLFLAVWMGSLSGFIFANNWIGPWPAAITQVPERIFFTFHMLGGMLFGGGVIMTTGLELLVTKNKRPEVLQFYFDKVPLLDSAVVLPGLTIAMISGTGLCVTRYGSLGGAPAHIPVVFYCLTAFAAWWAATDLATQPKAMRAIDEWVAKGASTDIPAIVEDRFISNIVSCLFVVALYGIMVLKPGTLPQYTPHLPHLF
mmetsp:Transcript_16119/g.35853  ORF Transcript_16119/g.35853 Transcript_16119/m.35853 type:complete len:321 (+) Transcript_16119:172-1134(+)